METQTQHPPVSQNQMPQWARVGQLDKARYPKVFTRDEFIPVTLEMSEGEGDPASAIERLDEQNPAIRVEYLERNIRFLKKQHQEILGSLHNEIDKLRNENKDLHFKLVMKQRIAGDDENLSEAADEVFDNVKVPEKGNITRDAKSSSRKLEQQLKDLRQQVRELQNKNDYLSKLVESKQQFRTGPDSISPSAHETASSATGSEICINIQGLSKIQHTKPVMVHDRNGSARRCPTHDELVRIINLLQENNHQQERELVKAKAELNEVLNSQKPEAYLVAKAYVAKDGVAEETDILPKLQMKSMARRLPDIAYISRDTASLPALKNTMGTKAAERRKRTQILQRARLQHKEVS